MARRTKTKKRTTRTTSSAGRKTKAAKATTGSRRTSGRAKKGSKAKAAKKGPGHGRSAKSGSKKSKKRATKARPAKTSAKRRPKKSKATAKKTSSRTKGTKKKSAKTRATTSPSSTSARRKKASARSAPKPEPGRAPSILSAGRQLNNYVLVVFDSCRFDSFVKGNTRTIQKLGELERRWSYASWTAPSHYNLLTGLMPHSSPQNVYASEYYKRDFLKYNERLNLEGTSFKSLIPHLYFPVYLQSLGYRTHARVSLPVLNPKTTLNNGFDTFRLMPKHNDMAAIVDDMRFSDDRPSFWLLNIGETHYPYALPDEPPDQWPRISGVHGVFKHLDDHVVDGQLSNQAEPAFFDEDKMKQLHRRQVLAVEHLDRVVEQLFDIVPENTYITVTADHGELFGEAGYFGHGPIHHDKVFEVPFLEGKLK